MEGQGLQFALPLSHCVSLIVHVMVSTQGQVYSFTVHSKSREGFYEPFGSAAVRVAPLIVPTHLLVKSCSHDSVTVQWVMSRVPPAGGSGVQGGQPVVTCPEGRVLFTMQGSVVTRSSPAFDIPCSSNESVPSSYTIQGLTNNAIYALSIEARNPLAAQGGGPAESYTPWVGTSGLNTVQASPVASPFDLQIRGVTAFSAMLTWRAGMQGVRARAYWIEYTALSPGANRGAFRTQHVGGPGTMQGLNVTGLSSGYQYSIIVRAETPSGIKAPYDAAPAVTTPIATPTRLSVAAVDAQYVSFSWLPAAKGWDFKTLMGSAADHESAQADTDPVLPTNLALVLTRLSDGHQTTFGPFAALSSWAQVGPLELGTTYNASLIARAATGDELIPPVSFPHTCHSPQPSPLPLLSFSSPVVSSPFLSAMLLEAQSPVTMDCGAAKLSYCVRGCSVICIANSNMRLSGASVSIMNQLG